jgi:hypothetical protein
LSKISPGRDVPFSTLQVRQALTCKVGVAPSHTDREIFESVHDGLVVATTKISHPWSGRDVGNTLLDMMARQCHVPEPVFRDALACRVSMDDFIKEMLNGIDG